jgi:hypothetical protein
MRWLKVLVIAVAVVVVFVVISALVHILYLVGVGLLIAAALFAAVKGWRRPSAPVSAVRSAVSSVRSAAPIRLSRRPGSPLGFPARRPGSSPPGSRPPSLLPASTWKRSLPASSTGCLTVSPARWVT